MMNNMFIPICLFNLVTLVHFITFVSNQSCTIDDDEKLSLLVAVRRSSFHVKYQTKFFNTVIDRLSNGHPSCAISRPSY